MKALLLAAGKATRLGALSQNTPKCLQQVGDEILLDRVVRQLREVGVTKFLINTHHLAEQIADHIAGRPDQGDFKVVYEPSLLGTLGTVKANADFFEGDPGWVIHADNFIEGELSPVLNAFAVRVEDVWGSMLTFEVDDPALYGVVNLNSSGVVTSFSEKRADASGRIASAATFMFDERVFQLMEALPPSCRDISHDLLPQLVGRLVAAPAMGRVIDIGTPEGLATARRLARELDS